MGALEYKLLILIISFFEASHMINFEKPLENILIIPHSHMDPNWLNDFENNYNMYAQNIFTNIVDSLRNIPNMTFVVCEICLFKKFYEKSSNNIRGQIKRLIINKQIEFVNGGWVANDEATPYYSDIILLMRIGHEFLLKEFNVIPKIAWNVDSFGHNNANHYLLSLMGFDVLFYTRDSEKINKTINRELESVFFPFYRHFQDKYAILSSSYYYHYAFRSGICFESSTNCQDEQINSENSNEVIRKVLNNSQNAIQYYKSSSFLLLLGDDYAFKKEEKFTNLINFMELFTNYKTQNNLTVNISFGIPSSYFDNLYLKKFVFASKTKDSIPLYQYGQYWSGYYSTWPSLKYLIRYCSKKYRSLSIIFSMISINQNYYKNNFFEIQRQIRSLE